MGPMVHQSPPAFCFAVFNRGFHPPGHSMDADVLHSFLVSVSGKSEGEE